MGSLTSKQMLGTQRSWSTWSGKPVLQCCNSPAFGSHVKEEWYRLKDSVFKCMKKEKIKSSIPRELWGKGKIQSSVAGAKYLPVPILHAYSFPILANMHNF